MILRADARRLTVASSGGRPKGSPQAVRMEGAT